MKKHISLSITERCNLNCIYCFEKSKKKETMCFDTAIKVLTYELENSPEFDEISCDFMGGEPFLEFDLIKKVCEYFWVRDNSKKISFYTTTNGTLVHGQIKEWLQKNFHRFSCMLSLDGCAESHNTNRSGSFDRIDIPFFLKMWPDMKVKAITSKKTLLNLSENVMYLHELGFKKVEMKLAYGFNWNDRSLCETLERELLKLKEFYLCHPDIEPCSLLNIDFSQVNNDDKITKKWCNAGQNTVSYDMQGRKYPCRYFQDLVINGHITHDEMWAHDYSTIQNSLIGQCTKCLLRDLCRTCYAYNYEKLQNFGVKDMGSCRITRITIGIAASLFVEKNSAGLPGETVECSNAKRICDAVQNHKWFI